MPVLANADYIDRINRAIDHITRNLAEPLPLEDVARVANKYIDVDHLAIVIVGDRKTIEQPLKATGIAPLVVLDINGDPVAVP